MDLEARVRAFAAAVAAREPLDGYLADGAAFELGGRLVGRDAFLAALPSLAVRDVAVKRNVTFAWVAAGVLVMSWDQDGRAAHLSWMG